MITTRLYMKVNLQSSKIILFHKEVLKSIEVGLTITNKNINKIIKLTKIMDNNNKIIKNWQRSNSQNIDRIHLKNLKLHNKE
jgi:hypothetical protein